MLGERGESEGEKSGGREVIGGVVDGMGRRGALSFRWGELVLLLGG